MKHLNSLQITLLPIQASNFIDHFAFIIVWTKCLPPSITKPNNFFCYKPISTEPSFRSLYSFTESWH